MKKTLFMLAAFVGMASADMYTTHVSSNITGTSQTGCIANTNSAPVYLDKINVPTATSGGSLVIYNSSWTLTAPIVSSTTLATVMSYDYNDTKLSGICYRASLPTNGVTIIYHK